MATTVEVRWEDGKPCSGTRVRLWLDGDANREEFTDANGEAHFDYGPGRGTLYCDGHEVRNGHLSSYERVTCHTSGIFSYTYS